MNSQAFTEFRNDRHTGPARRRGRGKPAAFNREPALVVQILSVIAFGIFSIVAVSLAFTAFWVAGLVITVLIAWTWAGSRMFGGRSGTRHSRVRQAVSDVAPPVLDRRSSGNASFDAYRAEMLVRLERESHEFEGFLTRLRAARDATEFDQFLDERASAAREALATDESRDVGDAAPDRA